MIDMNSVIVAIIKILFENSAGASNCRWYKESRSSEA
jgi:hypothetical protein